MIGILVEKPSAARNFASALGGMRGNYNGEDYVIVNARGHLYEFSKPNNQVRADLVSKYKNWDLVNLPWDETEIAWKREAKEDVGSLLKDIKATLSKCDKVYLSCDWDVATGEGDLLAIEIMQELKIRPKEFRRIYFTDEAPVTLQKAFVNAQVIPDINRHPDYLKAIYRSKFDFLTMQFTRIATKHGDGQSLLRQGRLKSAVVLLVGDGCKAVKEYKKVPFYSNKFKDDKGVIYTNKDEPVFPKKADVLQTYSQGHVTVDKKEMKKTVPPKLMDLAALSGKLASAGVNAQELLAEYQKMYECQILSYPRTSDATITPEQFDELLPKIDKIAQVVGVDPSLLTMRKPRSTHVKTGGSHGANRPGPRVPNSLSDLNQFGKYAALIYETVARNYLAMLCEDYQYESQSGHITEYPNFKGTCSVPVNQGWKLVFQTGDDDDDGKGLGTVADPFIHEGFPPKPPTPTIKWLMKQLERRDVGTGATRVSCIAEISNQRSNGPLLKESKGKLTLTQYGEMSYRLLPGTHIGSLDLTEEVQNDMKLIAEGKLDGDEALKKVRQYVIEDRDTMAKNGEKMRKEMGIMPQSEVPQAERYSGTWKGTSVSFKREWSGHRFTDDECERLCNGEEISIFGLKSKSGSEYGVTGKLSNQTFNGHKFVGFERTGFANDPARAKELPTQWCGHKFTDDEMSLLKQGREVYCEGFVSKKTGKTFDCKVQAVEKDGRVIIEPHFE